MPKRSKEWNEGLAKDLRDTQFAHKFILAAVNEEALPIQVVLGKVIRAYGLKEFARKVKIAPSNIVRAVNPKHNPTQDTLNKLLRPFKLQLTIAPIEMAVRKYAA